MSRQRVAVRGGLCARVLESESMALALPFEKGWVGGLHSESQQEEVERESNNNPPISIR